MVGELNPQTVREHLRKQAEGLKRCFRDSVDTSDRVGHVILRLKVNGDGKVERPSSSGAAPSSARSARA